MASLQAHALQPLAIRTPFLTSRAPAPRAHRSPELLGRPNLTLAALKSTPPSWTLQQLATAHLESHQRLAHKALTSPPFHGRPGKPFLCGCRDVSSERSPAVGCPSPSTSRRLLLVGAVTSTTIAVAFGLAASGALAGTMMLRQGDYKGAIAATRLGMSKFVEGDVAGSVEDFDRAMAIDPSRQPYLWQRGLSLYYLGRFEEGAQQFRDDVAVNPNDTEESIWCYLCEAQTLGPEEARARFLQVGRDPRPVMRAAYELFRDGGSPDTLMAAAGDDTNHHDAFYALLYIGLYHEAQGETEAARDAITQAVRTAYGARSDDYMAKLAKIHCKSRGWDVDGL